MFGALPKRAKQVPTGSIALGEGGGQFREQLGQRVTGMRLDLEPDAEFCFRRPDGDHFRPGVTRDHGNDFLSRGNLLPV